MGGGLIEAMNELRWILLIVGIAVLAVMYVLGRKEQLRRRRRRREDADEMEDTAGVSLDTRSEYEDFAPAQEHFEVSPTVRVEDEPESAPEPVAPASPPPEIEPVSRPRPKRIERQPLAKDKIISLYLVARRPSLMRGDAIRQAAENAELEYGDMQIFHRAVERNGRRQILFSMASAMQPGTFDLDDLQAFTTPGLALFMQLPGPNEGLKTFNAMLDCAQQMAVELGAELRDEARSALSAQTIDHMREEIQLFSLRTARARPQSF